MTDVTQLTADALLQLYRTGQASPVEVTQQVLNRIARLNPVLNAFCWVDEPAALQSARLSEQRWQAHRHQGATVGALEGVPVSIKDLILTRGWPTLRGSRTVDPAQAWEVDAPATARLREAGAVLLGKTVSDSGSGRRLRSSACRCGVFDQSTEPKRRGSRSRSAMSPITMSKWSWMPAGVSGLTSRRLPDMPRCNSR